MIGLGAVAQAVHLPLLAKHPDLFRTTALCDLSRSNCGALGDLLGVHETRRFSDVDELLAADELDAVAVLTSGSHGRLAEAAARAGLAVFCEKPLAYTLEEADALAALEPRLQLGYMKLYDPAVERARELLARRPPARSVEVTVLHPPAPPQLAHASLLPPADDIDPTSLERLTAEQLAVTERALGAVPAELAAVYTEILLGSLVHDLAVVRYLLGGTLAFDYGDAWPDGEPASSIALAGQLSGGTRVSMRWHYLESYPAYREEVRMHDEQGTVSLAFPSPYLLHAPTVLTSSRATRAPSESRSFAPPSRRSSAQWLAFAELRPRRRRAALRGRRGPRRHRRLPGRGRGARRAAGDRARRRGGGDAGRPTGLSC